MLVKATPGVKVPKEGAPREYITEAEAQTVPQSAYYLRRLDDGDLIRVVESTAKAKLKEQTDG
ncbi:MAG: DUF2635 domain-containing protein [Desulfovibrio sp.]|nr:DUF2635 domain-containing protein [Desulfovibrio sp.]MBI4960417.1 DUF2635 domain-containing protein [Desulfovibrio sp.]